MKKLDLKKLQRLAEKNREASRAQQEAEYGKPADGKRGKKRDFSDEPSKRDPRYEGADRLFTEMKKKDRP
ncbi:MAG: hypothetical protein O7F70_04030 [Gemmatimonadetes bacterium]|nr:hypothetical protein [Gemmatimonadota bacterium]